MTARAIATAFVVVVGVGGCFSEPARPHGEGAPIAAGSIVRRVSNVGDINNDGYDDLVLIGNESTPGQNPTAFIYFGGESLENPDLRGAIPIVPSPSPTVWYEAITASIYTAPNGGVPGVVVMTGQDASPKGSGDTGPTQRFVVTTFLPIENRQLGSLEQTDGALAHNIGGYAPDFALAFAVVRDTDASVPARQLVIGSTDIFLYDAPYDSTTAITTAEWSWQNDFGQTVHTLPPAIRAAARISWSSASLKRLPSGTSRPAAEVTPTARSI